jgi:hypothetical protein
MKSAPNRAFQRYLCRRDDGFPMTVGLLAADLPLGTEGRGTQALANARIHGTTHGGALLLLQLPVKSHRPAR